MRLSLDFLPPASRGKFLALAAALAAGSVAAIASLDELFGPGSWAGGLASCALVVCWLGLLCARLRDRRRSTLWLLLALVPFVGWLALGAMLLGRAGNPLIQPGQGASHAS